MPPKVKVKAKEKVKGEVLTRDPHPRPADTMTTEVLPPGVQHRPDVLIAPNIKRSTAVTSPKATVPSAINVLSNITSDKPEDRPIPK